MELILANMYIYIYENLYSLSGVYEKLTMYSDAIMGALDESGPLHDIYLLIQVLELACLLYISL